MSDNLKKAYANVVTQRYTFCFAVLSGNAALTSKANSHSVSFIPNILLRRTFTASSTPDQWDRAHGGENERSIDKSLSVCPNLQQIQQIITATTLGCIY